MLDSPIMLGPEFTSLPDDTEETVAGTWNHQNAVMAVRSGLQVSAQRRRLPWFVCHQFTLLVHQEGAALPRRFAPDISYTRHSRTETTTRWRSRPTARRHW